MRRTKLPAQRAVLENIALQEEAPTKPYDYKVGAQAQEKEKLSLAIEWLGYCSIAFDSSSCRIPGC